MAATAFPRRTFTHVPRLKHSPAYTPRTPAYTSGSTSSGVVTTIPVQSPDGVSLTMPAMYREPLCPHGALPRTERRPRRFSRRYPAFFAPMGSCDVPSSSHVLWFPLHAGPCRLLRAPAATGYLPALSPQSLCGRLDPYPAAPLRCFCPFLPEGLRPHLGFDRFGAPDTRRNATSTTGYFRGCSHSFMFRLPHSLDPLVAPTTGAQCPQGSWAVYTTQ